MADNETSQDELTKLRHEVERGLKTIIVKTVPSLQPENIEALVHELHVHESELQVQNEELRRTRQAAEDARDEYQELYESAPAGYVTLNAHLRITHMNTAGERLLGLYRTEVVGHPLAEFVVEQDVLGFIQCARKVFEAPHHVSCEVGLQCKDGVKTVLMDACLVGVEQEDRPIRVSLTDITARKEAEDRLKDQEQTLRTSQRELQALSVRLLAMEEEVRQRIAHDFQEEFSQRMAALLIKVSGLAQRPGVDSHARGELLEIRRHLSHMKVDFHHFAHGLYSGLLDHCALHVAMKDYIDDLNLVASPQITFKASDVPTGCRSDQAVALFRVLQESLANVAKHAYADAVAVTLVTTDCEIILTIRDNGKGFPYDPRVKAPAGFGLIIMRERMWALGGRFSIESHRGEGTTITAAMPLAPTTPIAQPIPAR